MSSRQAAFGAEGTVPLEALLTARERRPGAACAEAVAQFVGPTFEMGQTRPKIKIYTNPKKTFLRLTGRGMWIGLVLRTAARQCSSGSRGEMLIDAASIEGSSERTSPNYLRGNRG